MNKNSDPGAYQCGSECKLKKQHQTVMKKIVIDGRPHLCLFAIRLLHVGVQLITIMVMEIFLGESYNYIGTL